MARIPRLDRPQVRPTPERPNLPAVNPAQAVGVALQQTAQATDEFARELNRLNEIRVNEALETFAARADTLLTDPKDGLLAKRGTKAAEGLDPFRDRLTVSRADIGATLGNENQRQLFAQQSERFARDASRRAFGYVRDETQRVDVASFAALNRRDMDRIATVATEGGDPESVIRELDRRVALFGDRQGWTPEMIADARTEAVSNARLAQVTALVAAAERNPALSAQVEAFGKDERAMADLTPADREKARTLMEDANLVTRAQRASDAILATHGDDERAALAKAREYEGKMRDEVVRRVERRFIDERRLFNQSVADHFNTALNAVEQGGEIPADERGWLLTNAPDKLNALRQRRQQVQRGVAVVTDYRVWGALDAMSDADLVQVNLFEHKADLSDRHFEAMLGRQNDIKAGRRATLSPTRIMDDAFDRAKRMGLIDGNVRTLGQLERDEYRKDKQEWTKVDGAVRDALATAQQAKDPSGAKPLTGPEIHTAVESVFDDLVLEKYGFLNRKVRVLPRALASDPEPLDAAVLGQMLDTGTVDLDDLLGAYDAPASNPNVPPDIRYSQLLASGVPRDIATLLVTREANRP